MPLSTVAGTAACLNGCAGGEQMEEKKRDSYVHRKGAGMPLVMVHGIISDSSFFEESAEILAEDYQVITYDRRGYGENTQEKYSDYSVHAQAEDLAEILEAYCSEPAWVVGNSAGGLIAIEAALFYPELIRGMILIEPSLGYEETEREKLLSWNQELNQYVKEGRIKSALPAFSRITGGGKGKKAASLKEIKRSYQNLFAFMYNELNEVQRYLPPAESLKRLPMPVLTAVTEEGRNSIFATSSETGAKKLGWPVVTLPGFHNVAKDLPREFAACIKELLSGRNEG